LGKKRKESEEQFDLTAECKTQLLALGLSTQTGPADEDEVEARMSLLYEILRGRLPVARRTIDALPAELQSQCQDLQSVAGASIGDLLQNPHVEMSLIQKVKDHAKTSGTLAASQAESDAFLAVYHGAIAAALVYYGRKITKHSTKDLTEFFQSLDQKDWILPELKRLFAKAREYCDQLGDTPRPTQ
jgi:hypothetical protein